MSQIFEAGKVISVHDMQLRDVVTMLSGGVHAWGFGVVKQIRDGMVTIFRPYVTTSEMATTSGVIPYIGIEQYSIEIDSSVKFLLWERSETR